MSAIRFSLSTLSLIFEERRNGRAQFVPVFQERVVPAQRVYLYVARVRSGLSRSPGRRLHLVRREEPVARDPDEKDLRLDPGVGLFLGLVACRDVVEVHRAREVEVGVGVEASHEILALVVEVALDLEPPAELFVQSRAARGPPPEPLPLPGGALISHHPGHARYGEAGIGGAPCTVEVAALPVGVGHDGASPELAHPHPLWTQGVRRRHGHGLLDKVGELDSPLERLLTADGAPDHKPQPSYPQSVQKTLLRPDHVPDGHDGEAHRVRAPALGVGGGRPCAPVATSDHVRADDEVPPCVYTAPPTTHRAPPTTATARRIRLIGGARIACQGVDDKNGVLARIVKLAPGLVGERDFWQRAAEFRLEVAYAVVEFARSGRSLPSPGPRV